MLRKIVAVFLALATVVMLFTACDGNEEPTTNPTISTGEVSTTETTTETTTESTTENTSTTTTETTTSVDSSTTQTQTGNLEVSAPAVTKTSPQISTLKTDTGVVDLRNRPQMGAEYVIREETEAREVKIYAHTLENGFYWVYIELDGQFYWVRADGITDAIYE